MALVIEKLEQIDEKLLDIIISCLKISHEKTVFIKSCLHSPTWNQILDPITSIYLAIATEKIEQNKENISTQDILKIKIGTKSIKDLLKKIHNFLHQLDPDFFGISYEEILSYIQDGDKELFDFFGSKIQKIIRQEYLFYQENLLMITQKLKNEGIKPTIIIDPTFNSPFSF